MHCHPWDEDTIIAPAIVSRLLRLRMLLLQPHTTFAELLEIATAFLADLLPYGVNFRDYLIFVQRWFHIGSLTPHDTKLDNLQQFPAVP